jgi:predicted membrane channel-forming protein YqfA (hemolysin III family)
VQTHGGIEGVVAHEVGHFLFFAGMLFILLQGGVNRWTAPGWPYFQKFLYLVLFWNVLTFIEHIMDLSPLADNVIRLNGVATGYILNSAAGAFYYFSRLDHLILVPALYFFMRALQIWTAKSGDKP